MNIDKCREALRAADAPGVAEPIWQASMCAEDNAGQTLIDQGRKADRYIEGTDIYSDDMVFGWAASLQDIMSTSDCNPAVQEFFAPFGIKA